MVALKRSFVVMALLLLLGSRNAVVALKRDRMGPDGPASGPRSRNAVVALKRGLGDRVLREFNGSRNAVVALKPAQDVTPTPTPAPKQERRGGIETPGAASLSPAFPGEAGTPWWH